MSPALLVTLVGSTSDSMSFSRISGAKYAEVMPIVGVVKPEICKIRETPKSQIFGVPLSSNKMFF